MTVNESSINSLAKHYSKKCSSTFLKNNLFLARNLPLAADLLKFARETLTEKLFFGSTCPEMSYAIGVLKIFP